MSQGGNTIVNVRGRTTQRLVAAAAMLALVVLIVPQMSSAAASCGVLFDASGDVAGPLGTPRPTQSAGREIDLSAVSMTSSPADLSVWFRVADLSAHGSPGTGGAFYTAFFSIGAGRFFAQATRIADQWTYSAGPTPDVKDTVPQSGATVDGSVSMPADTVRVIVPRELIGSPASQITLEQIRAGAAESVYDVTSLDRLVRTGHTTANQDWAGGAEGGHFLLDGACLPEISGAGERCLVASDPAADAGNGEAPAAAFAINSKSEPNASVSTDSSDPATEILSLQMGSNAGTVVAEVGVASLRGPLPTGASAEQWTVHWVNGKNSYDAIAQRYAQTSVFEYSINGATLPTTGSIDSDGGAVRILVPRHEIGADSETRFTSVQAHSAIMYGVIAAERDSAPNASSFGTQFVAGVSCADQQKAACPVVVDPAGDASVADADGKLLGDQPASDLTAAGVSAPDGTLVMSARVADIGAPPPAGFDEQGWTASWVFGGQRYFAQARRTKSSTKFTYGVLGSAAAFPGPVGYQRKATDTTGTFDVAAGVIRVVVPAEAVGSPGFGATLDEVGVRSWIRTTSEAAPNVYPPARQDTKVDDTPLAPYVVGLSCGA